MADKKDHAADAPEKEAAPKPAEKPAAKAPAPPVVLAGPHRTESGKLTHAGMVAAIKAGGSVLFNGEVISDIGLLPDEASVVKGDPSAEATLLQSIDAQIASLAEQRAKLKSEAKPEPKTEPKVEIVHTPAPESSEASPAPVKHQDTHGLRKRS